MEGEFEGRVGVCEDYRGIGGEVRPANMCRENLEGRKTNHGVKGTKSVYA